MPLVRVSAEPRDRLDEILLGMGDLRRWDSPSSMWVAASAGRCKKLTERIANLRMVGVNIDPRQLAICRQLEPREGNGLEWALADACGPPFADASVDRVLCVEAMFHFALRRSSTARRPACFAPAACWCSPTWCSSGLRRAASAGRRD